MDLPSLFNRKRRPDKNDAAAPPDAAPGPEAAPPAGTLAAAEACLPIAVRSGSDSSARWMAAGASVAGPSHEKLGTVRQDEFAFALVGDILIAAVCDGMGSARLSQYGAALCSQTVVRQLTGYVEAAGKQPDLSETTLDNNPAGEWTGVLLSAIREAKGTLDEAQRAAGPGSGPLFDTTLLGVIAAPGAGWFFHIGDGCCIAAASSEPGVFEKTVVSQPENGEFSNITFPATMDGFEDHLRFTAFGPADVLFLMTDGVTPFALENDDLSLRARFLQPIDAHLSATGGDTGAGQLADTLNSPSIREQEGDDKTLFWARRQP